MVILVGEVMGGEDVVVVGGTDSLWVAGAAGWRAGKHWLTGGV